MTPRQLKYFIEIARQLSFTKASATLHITQPALSRQVQELESALGVKLFTRSDMGVTLTAAGQLLYSRAPALLDSFRQLGLDVTALADTPAGSLRFGVPPSLCGLLTIPAAVRYKQLYPEVKLSITEASSTELTEAILSGQLDFAIVAQSDWSAQFACTPLIREQMYLASRPGTLDLPGEVDTSALVPLALLASRRPNALRRILDNAVADAGGSYSPVLEANSIRILTQASAQGVGSCVLPYSAIAEAVSLGQLQARAVRGLSVQWALLHMRNIEPTPSVVALLNIIIDMARCAHEEQRWQGMELLARHIG